ncbi:MOSC domain-containing protein YiiM [Cytobacillus horneckiae]|uniref:MOSC domain-containing protein n=1 Tax=Cytobacillus horneckiae TaxID=549687 RepID=A0A2N0ZLE0_9BACI|nr:MOSC domain-containing protein [Cytobacillus horneckiae]MBN6885777.1 MOSC domain-containing protein [Cytobacillus horneckiae]MCM3177322.1 MOSC domain-containing protein [Cytobacillus horneckiae]MEC1156115.1 MOSC domain-containing protein [Cytobacillus horneckiae]MED2937475.1 MOSC domain-containing protein [Cytobacillus horneckiae]PKG30345.1 MOSC domain-containing protein [Cytobacillus horneckiae]
MKLITLSVGKPKTHEWKGKTFESGIGKSKVVEAFLTKDAFIGDGVANPAFHGGPDRAVCLYSYEHYQYWKKEFNHHFELPAFGENICATGMLEKDVYIGDIFSLGEAEIQITQGRIPCSTISKHNNLDPLLPRIVETGYTGYFFKVLKEGKVNSHSRIELVDRVQTIMTVLEANKIILHKKRDKDALETLLQINELADDWKERLQKALKKF